MAATYFYGLISNISSSMDAAFHKKAGDTISIFIKRELMLGAGGFCKAQ